MYLSFSIKQRTTKHGKLLSVSANRDKLILELQSLPVNDKGYFYFDIAERREPGQYGETHFAKLNEWKPDPKSEPEKNSDNNSNQ